MENIKSRKSLLTPREKEVVELILKEYSTKRIADTLKISPRTVETHRQNIMRKTGSSNIVGLIKYVYQNRWN